MKTILIFNFLTILLFFNANTFASEHQQEEHQENHQEDGHTEGKAIGHGKAIEEVNKEKGFRLSKEAIKTLEIKLLMISQKNIQIDKKTLVTSKKIKGVYRLRDGYFKLLPIDLKEEINGKYLISLQEIKSGDQVVIEGAGLLRVADIYTKDKAQYSHSH